MNQSEKKHLLKKLLYQSCYRGCKETDFIIGNFAKKYLFKLSDTELEDFAEILKLNDADFYDWYVGKKPLPPNLSSNIMLKMLKFKVDSQ